jgi:hypothetical protein
MTNRFGKTRGSPNPYFFPYRGLDQEDVFSLECFDGLDAIIISFTKLDKDLLNFNISNINQIIVICIFVFTRLSFKPCQP